MGDLAMEDGLQKHFLLGNEILLTAKGETNEAYLLPGITSPAVASSAFLIITLSSDLTSTQYLGWYLNTRKCQLALSQLSRGSAVHSLAKRDLQQIAIPLPPLRIQRAIISLTDLQRTERELYEQIITEKESLAEAQLLQLTTNSTTPNSIKV